MALLDELRSGQVVADDQDQSSLFRLPLEVRRQVYDYAYPEHMVHMHWPRTKEIYWCIEPDEERHEDIHVVCDWVKAPFRHMLGMPLACRRSYSETVTLLYSRHTFHFRDEFTFVDFTKAVPEGHLNALESLRLTVGWDPFGPEEWQRVWNTIASLPSLRTLRVSVVNCDLPTRWKADTLPPVADPIKAVQQETIEKFDLMFGVGAAWFEHQYADHMYWSGLNWDAFLVDFEWYAEFEGVHPKARVICVNGFKTHHPVRDELPTMMDMLEWIDGFEYNPDYELESKDDYELGPRAKAFKEAQDEMTTEDRERKSQEAQRLVRELRAKYVEDKGYADGPDGWDWDAFKRLAELADSVNATAQDIGKWTYPEKPEWWAV